MRPFRSVTGVVAPLDRSDVDTDQIVPKEFLKRVERTGFGRFLFHDWRYAPDGSPRPDFVLNVPAYQGASILVAGRNFGCGSSREHAAWALLDYGFRAVIAPAFADIFHNNCFKNGILPVTLDEADVRRILRNAETRPGYRLTVDLEAQQVCDEEGGSVEFAVDPFRRRCLLEGLDDIALSFRHADAITDYESRRPSWLPSTKD